MDILGGYSEEVREMLCGRDIRYEYEILHGF